jgi:hypothetical protein
MDHLKFYSFVPTSEGEKPLGRIILKCIWSNGIWCDGAEWNQPA